MQRVSGLDLFGLYDHPWSHLFWRTSNNRIIWQGFMGRSIFWGNNFQLVFQWYFDPLTDFPEIVDILNTFQDDDDNAKKTKDELFRFDW